MKKTPTMLQHLLTCRKWVNTKTLEVIQFTIDEIEVLPDWFKTFQYPNVESISHHEVTGRYRFINDESALECNDDIYQIILLKENSMTMILEDSKNCQVEFEDLDSYLSSLS